MSSWLDIFVFTYAICHKIGNCELEINKKTIGSKNYIEEPKTDLSLKNEPQSK